jgi:hypothetical protein
VVVLVTKLTPKAEKKYGWRLLVAGCGGFPTDMLRYDECFPIDESEARGMVSDHGHRTVRLERWASHPGHPIARRWESQGWKVIACEPIRGRVAEASDFWDRCESLYELRQMDNKKS